MLNRTKTSKVLVGSMLAVLGYVSTANAAVAPFSATYNFSIENKYKGVATRTLQQSGNKYQYNVNANVGKLASARQSASFFDQNGNVTPISSYVQYKVFGAGRATSLNFDNSKKQLTSNYKGQNKVIPLPGVAYDDLSLEIQIREDLKAGKFRGTYAMADRSSIESVPFVKSAVTKITVPAGTFDVVRIDRVHDESSRQTSFWLAPKYDYLPIKVVQNDDGKKLEMSLAKIN